MQIAQDLRDRIIEYHEHSGEDLDTPEGLLRLDADSVLAANRGRMFLRLLAEAGAGPIAGWRVLNLGAGFGALALYWAHLGAEVLAIDPDPQRVRIAVEIAERRGLTVNALTADPERLPLPDASLDLALTEDCLFGVIDEQQPGRALREIHRVLRPGGWLVTCNPNRLHPHDQFTGLPVLRLLPRALAQQVAEALGHHRPNVRLRSPGGAVRQLRRAGFTQAHWHAQLEHGLGARFASHHHVIARRPAGPTEDRGLRRKLRAGERRFTPRVTGEPDRHPAKGRG
jgi:SAM-dependent methyltransferase